MRKRESTVRLIAIGMIVLAVLVGLGITYLSGDLSAQSADQPGLFDWLRTLFG